MIQTSFVEHLTDGQPPTPVVSKPQFGISVFIEVQGLRT